MTPLGSRSPAHAYPRRAIAGDALRSGLGVSCTWGPLAALTLPVWVAVVFGVVGGLFAYFGVLTVLRARTKIRVTEAEISIVPGARAIAWRELTEVRLSYYATRSDNRQGWMQLVLGKGRTRIKLDSRLEGFVDIAGRALRAARRNELSLDPVTASNMLALGLSAADEGAELEVIVDGDREPPH